MHTIILNTGDIVFLGIVVVGILAIAYFIGKARGIQEAQKLVVQELKDLWSKP